MMIKRHVYSLSLSIVQVQVLCEVQVSKSFDVLLVLAQPHMVQIFEEVYSFEDASKATSVFFSPARRKVLCMWCRLPR